MIYEKYKRKKADKPNEKLVNLLSDKLKQEEQSEWWIHGQDKEERYKPLWEIYYYLFYGLYTSAWNKIQGLPHDLRWKIPGDVYHYLLGMHEEVVSEEEYLKQTSVELNTKTKAKRKSSKKASVSNPKIENSID